jgi:hypothetical protein
MTTTTIVGTSPGRVEWTVTHWKAFAWGWSWAYVSAFLFFALSAMWMFSE